MSGGRPVTNLAQYRELITHLHANGSTQSTILDTLYEDHGVKVSARTLKNRLAEWGLRARKPNTTNHDQATVLELYREHAYDDETAAIVLQQFHGLSISARQVQDIRLKHGIKRQYRDTPTEDSAMAQTLTFCWDAILHGPARDYGRGFMRTYLRLRYGFHAREDHVREALRIILAQQGFDRRPILKSSRRHEAIFEGPNHVWSVDGYEKLGAIGIEIYGAIDTHSRCLQWLYVGISSRTQISVLKQYLIHLKRSKHCPQRIRADRGRETPMIADLHYALWRTHCRENGIAIDPDKCFAQCFLFGRSTANQRIESLWLRIARGCTRTWRYLFKYLAEEDLLLETKPTDQAVALYIFMPLIRKEVQAWMDCHNHSPIRRDAKRGNHTSGRPWDLYHGISTRLRDADAAAALSGGFAAHEALVDEYLDELHAFDLDEYVSGEVDSWCMEFMRQHHPEEVVATEFLPQQPRQKRIPLWYRRMVLQARQYVASGEGVLPLLASPTDGYGWLERHSDVVTAWARTNNTLGTDAQGTTEDLPAAETSEDDWVTTDGGD